VVQQGGEELWHSVCREAGLEPLTFVAQVVYPDEITYNLVAAVSKVTGMSQHDILVAFGDHWSRYTGNQGYGEMYKLLGNDYATFLTNLPRLHDHVAFIFPDLQMPQFEAELFDERFVRVFYRSERPGLSPMVFGLLEGMGKVYNTKVVVTHVRAKSEDFDADEFVVEILPLLRKWRSPRTHCRSSS
jgi:hypothetical protein